MMFLYCWKGGLRVVFPLQVFVVQTLEERTGHLKSEPLLGCRVLNCDWLRRLDQNVLRLGWRWKKSVCLFTVPKASNSKNGFYWNTACAKNKLWTYANYEQLKLNKHILWAQGKCCLPEWFIETVLQQQLLWFVFSPAAMCSFIATGCPLVKATL